MKIIAACLLASCSTLAAAEPAYIYMQKAIGEPGQTFDKSFAGFALYQERPCELPLVNAENMRAYKRFKYSPNDKEHFGCWADTVGNDYVLISGNGWSNSMPKVAFLKVAMKEDESFTVQESMVEKILHLPGQPHEERRQL